MLTFSQTPGNAAKIDYDNIVTEENMRKVLKYQIPTRKVWYNWKGKNYGEEIRERSSCCPPGQGLGGCSFAEEERKTDNRFF